MLAFNKHSWFKLFKLWLLAIPVIYGVYMLIILVRESVSFQELLTNHPTVAPFFIIACLSLIWFYVFQANYSDLESRDTMRTSLYIYVASALAVGNIVGIVTGILAIRELPKTKTFRGLTNCKLELALFAMSLFCGAVLLRLSLVS